MKLFLNKIIRQTLNSLFSFKNPFDIFPYIFKWILLSALLALNIGSASAIFLITLQWATDYRTNNTNLVYALPIIGFMIGFIYYKFGKESEGGNNLIIQAIQDNNTRVPFLMAPLVYVTTLATHLFGGSAGREGTALQMAGGLSYPITLLSNKLKIEKKNILLAAVAGGFVPFLERL